MAASPQDPKAGDGQTAQLAKAIQDVTEKAQLLVREEIELAKAEVTAKVSSLVRGLVIGAAAGIFVLAALLMLLHGFAWMAYYFLDVPTLAFFWGFLFVAGILLLLAAVAGFLAYKAVKKGSPPTPQMAIDEAKLIRETVQSSDPKKVG